ncbi:MAG TPA: hypothetical protein VJ140_07460, partial [Actinomycetota bacterium]|nr:hypothetical protein [Actinomycetota bacterium]
TGGLPVLAGHDLAVLGAWAVAGLLASVRLFRWEPQPPGQALTARWRRAPAPPHRSRTAAAGGDW